MKKKILFTAFLFFLAGFVSVIRISAETVYLDELQKDIDAGSIVFQNYSGPHKKIDTIDEIKGIGRYLGRYITSGPAEFTFFGKYSVIHAIDSTVREGLDADIFILGETAAVDHIKNLRRMISGYLEEAYDYETEQADLLAEFITIYNAVHRNDLTYFTAAYKKVVTNHLKPGKAGIALSYLEWPGNTMLLVPLTPQAGGDTISDINTDLLSDEDVINQLRKEDDRGVESRQGLVELKDKEVLEERAKIEQERKQIEEQADELGNKKEKLANEAEELKQDQSPGAEVRKDEIRKEIKEIENKEEELSGEQEVLDEREKKVEEREEKIVKEREAIAEDQMKNIEEDGRSSDKAIDKAEEKKISAKVPFLKISGDSGNYTGQLLLLDAEGLNILRRSEIDSIRLRGYTYTGKDIITVAGSEGGNRIVSLVRIDPETLEIKNSATAEVYIDSALVEASGKYYAVVREQGWKIGIFDNNLQLVSVSSPEVYPATDIVLSGTDVIVQGKSGGIIKIAGEDFSAPSF